MLALQERLFQQRIDTIVGRSTKILPDTILAVEHTEPVYTIGRRDTSAGLTKSPQELPPNGADTAALPPISTYKTKRGGGITWHGPGQLTVYPIANIKAWWEVSTRPAKNRSPIRWYSDVLEGAMCDTVRTFGVPSETGCVGVWVPSDVEGLLPRKVGSIGLQLSNWISMHGIGLNVCNDLSYFDRVVMCEMPNRRATSLHTEIMARYATLPLPAVEEVWPVLLTSITKNLHVEGIHMEEFDASKWSDDELLSSVLGMKR
jgi:lipoyl(octanoyl) transferase